MLMKRLFKPRKISNKHGEAQHALCIIIKVNTCSAALIHL